MDGPGAGSAAWSVEALHMRARAVHTSTARLVRARGHQTVADRIDGFAVSARAAALRAHDASHVAATVVALDRAPSLWDMLDGALEHAMALSGADFGNVQVSNPRKKTLRILAQRGFSAPFLDHFAVVADDATACGRAASGGRQSVIVDTDTDSDFAPHRRVAAESGFRAVQSTPLISTNGRLYGVMSTHFRAPHDPSAAELHALAAYGRLVADAIDRRVDALR